MARKRKTAKSKKIRKTPSRKLKKPIVNENSIRITEANIFEQELPQNKEVKRPFVAPSGQVFYPCQYCTKIFPRETTFTSHINRCSSKNNTQISTYNLTNENKEVNRSIAAPNGKLFYPCLYCSKIFPKETTSKSHMNKCMKNNPAYNTNKSKEPETTFDVETDTFLNRKNIQTKKEILKKSKGKSPKIVSSTTILRITPKSDQIVSNIGKYENTQCKNCPFIANNPIDLLRHKRTEHTVPKIFIHPTEVLKYMNGPKKNVCPICKKKIDLKNCPSKYARHLLSHTTGLPLDCKICGKKFRRFDSLRCHEARHVITYDEAQAIQNAVYEDDI